MFRLKFGKIYILGELGNYKNNEAMWPEEGRGGELLVEYVCHYYVSRAEERMGLISRICEVRWMLILRYSCKVLSDSMLVKGAVHFN